MTDVDRLRGYLGERIPEGGTESDTMFTDSQLLEILNNNNGDIPLATLDGWKYKAAEYAQMVDSAEGTAKRSLSDLHAHALEMVKYYGGGDAATPPSTTSTTVIHKIERW